LQKREFFKASVAMNDFFTEKYSMREGSDFKLKVSYRSKGYGKPANPGHCRRRSLDDYMQRVLVAFRSAEYAEAILQTAQSLVKALPADDKTSIIASAEIHGPLDFANGVEAFLFECRQDADKLQRQPARMEAEKAVQAAFQQVSGHAGHRVSSSSVDEASADGFVQVSKHGRTAIPRNEADLKRADTSPDASSGGHYVGKGSRAPPTKAAVDSSSSRGGAQSAGTLSDCTSSGYYSGKGNLPSQQASASASSVRPDFRRAGTVSGASVYSHYSGKGNTQQQPDSDTSSSRAGLQRAGTMFDPSSTGSRMAAATLQQPDATAYLSHAGDQSADRSNYGRNWRTQGQQPLTGTNSSHSSCRLESVQLPREVSALLQRDRTKGPLFHEDLKMFASKHSIVVESVGVTEVVLRPTGLLPHQQWNPARVELRGLLGFHFPDLGQDSAAALTAALLWRVEGHQCCVHVSEDGAGIELRHVEDGYLVDSVEDYPGQDFHAGEVIVEINGVCLEGLGEDEIEAAFGEQFCDGALLLLLSQRNSEG